MTDTVGPLPNLHPVLEVMGPSATVAINDRCNALKREGRDICKLGLGQSPFPVPDTVVRALQAHASEKDYLQTQGLAELRDAVAHHAHRTLGLSCSADHVIIGPGSKELMFLLQLAYSGDLLVPSPSWVSYAPQARLIGRPVHHLPTTREDDWRLTPATLDAHCHEGGERPRLLIMNYPSNPTGLSYSPAQLKELGDVARRHRILILADEIYGELHHDGAHTSIASAYPEGTIVSNGLSKWCGAGGWRLGTFLFPEGLSKLHAAVAAAGSETYTATSAPIQYAAVTAYAESAELDLYLERARSIVKALGQWCAATLRAAGADCPEPEGGFYLFPSFEDLRPALEARGVQDGPTLAERVLEDVGVAFLPGACFGRPREELTARLAYVDFDGAAALSAAEGATIDEAWLQAHCGPVVSGLRRFADWLNS